MLVQWKRPQFNQRVLTFKTKSIKFSIDENINIFMCFEITLQGMLDLEGCPTLYAYTFYGTHSLYWRNFRTGPEGIYRAPHCWRQTDKKTNCVRDQISLANLLCPCNVYWRLGDVTHKMIYIELQYYDTIINWDICMLCSTLKWPGTHYTPLSDR